MDAEDVKDLLTFRKMIAPIIVQVVFWFLIVLNLAGSIYLMTRGGWFVLFGFINIVLESLFIRLFAEILIVIFRMYESLREISTNTGATVRQYMAQYAQPAPAAAPAPVQQMAYKTCPRCQSSVDPSLSFCSNCGTPLT